MISFLRRPCHRKVQHMPPDIPQLRTAGVIAAELDAPLSRVLYVLRHRNIKPIGRAEVCWVTLRSPP